MAEPGFDVNKVYVKHRPQVTNQRDVVYLGESNLNGSTTCLLLRSSFIGPLGLRCVNKETKKQMIFSAKYSAAGNNESDERGFDHCGPVVTAPDSSYFQSVKKLNEIHIAEEGTSTSRSGSAENSHR